MPQTPTVVVKHLHKKLKRLLAITVRLTPLFAKPLSRFPLTFTKRPVQPTGSENIPCRQPPAICQPCSHYPHQLTISVRPLTSKPDAAIFLHPYSNNILPPETNLLNQTETTSYEMHCFTTGLYRRTMRCLSNPLPSI